MRISKEMLYASYGRMMSSCVQAEFDEKFDMAEYDRAITGDSSVSDATKNIYKKILIHCLVEFHKF